MLIVGCGITGALMAEKLTYQGLDVVIIDREFPATAAPLASTSMLLWEIDRSLSELTEAYGFERADAGLSGEFRGGPWPEIAGPRLDLPCEMRDKDSLYLAGRRQSSKELMQEHALRSARDCRATFSTTDAAHRI